MAAGVSSKEEAPEGCGCGQPSFEMDWNVLQLLNIKQGDTP
jgi:hypothetical protein